MSYYFHRGILFLAAVSLLVAPNLLLAQQPSGGIRIGLGQQPQSGDIRLGLGEKQPTPAGERKSSYDLEVSGGQPWLDTKIDLRPGDRVALTATGTVQLPMASAIGPQGLGRAWIDLIRILPVNGAGRGALVGRIGNGDISPPFLIGAQRDIQVRQAGRLFLGINQASGEQASGSFKVKVQLSVVKAAASTGNEVTPAETVNPADVAAKLTPELLQKIPRRVVDADGNAGDMVNFLILGSEDQMRLAFESAGWVLVDKTTKDAVLHGVISSISKQSYVEMPMSILTLFGRPQDYGFAHAEPVKVVSTRHHLRLWKAPFMVDGQTVWVGAGTHDIGFERDQRNNGVTHKIDPAVDGERDFIGKSLGSTGIVLASTYVTPQDPVKEARTATGGSFHSDGRILVMQLAHSGNDKAASFTQVFCSVLRDENPDKGDWGDCSQYLETDSAPQTASLAPISDKYRILILPGFMSSCISSVQALGKGQEHLRDEHHLEVEYLSLPNESSETNGKLIADYLKEHSKTDPRKYIVIGYSKGAPDFQVAMAQDPEAASGVAAFVSLAGAVGGSPVADALPAIMERYTKTLNLGTCRGDMAQAARSLRRDIRHNFLDMHQQPLVPTYSLAAASDKTNTSKMLMQAWQLLSVYDPEQDSQLTKSDAVVPGSTFLGLARADHLAVALAFEDAADAQIKSVMDHNHYPRAALLESIVRFVTADLEKK